MRKSASKKITQEDPDVKPGSNRKLKSTGSRDQSGKSKSNGNDGSHSRRTSRSDSNSKASSENSRRSSNKKDDSSVLADSKTTNQSRKASQKKGKDQDFKKNKFSSHARKPSKRDDDESDEKPRKKSRRSKVSDDEDSDHKRNQKKANGRKKMNRKISEALNFPVEEPKILNIYPDIDNPIDGPVKMSIEATHSAPQVKISEDGLTVSNEKGYRMAKATHGVWEGHWYYEVRIHHHTGNSRFVVIISDLAGRRLVVICRRVSGTTSSPTLLETRLVPFFISLNGRGVCLLHTPRDTVPTSNIRSW
jgi:hypothetical protein